MRGRGVYPGHTMQLHVQWYQCEDRNGNVWLVQGGIESESMGAQAQIGLCCCETQASTIKAFDYKFSIRVCFKEVVFINIPGCKSSHWDICGKQLKEAMVWLKQINKD